MEQGRIDWFDQLGFRKFCSQGSLGDLGRRTHEGFFTCASKEYICFKYFHPCVTVFPGKSSWNRSSHRERSWPGLGHGIWNEGRDRSSKESQEGGTDAGQANQQLSAQRPCPHGPSLALRVLVLPKCLHFLSVPHLSVSDSTCWVDPGSFHFPPGWFGSLLTIGSVISPS